MDKGKFLADVNVLLALTDEDHVHHAKAMQWFCGPGGRDWGMCALSGAGLLRLLTNPRIGSLSIAEAMDILTALTDHPGFRFWPIVDNWSTLAAPFLERVFGHQQITDAYLLGLAVKEGGVLVTMDIALKYLAGARYGDHVLLLK